MTNDDIYEWLGDRGFELIESPGVLGKPPWVGIYDPCLVAVQGEGRTLRKAFADFRRRRKRA